jgi:hypothetical protein
MAKQGFNCCDDPGPGKSELDRKLDAAGWGLFFIWVGISFILDLGWGIGLIGVSVLTLGEQVVRNYLGLKLEGFWVVAGIVFLLAGIFTLVGVEFSLVPIVLIAVGVALLLSIVKGKTRKGE